MFDDHKQGGNALIRARRAFRAVLRVEEPSLCIFVNTVGCTHTFLSSWNLEGAHASYDAEDILLEHSLDLDLGIGDYQTPQVDTLASRFKNLLVGSLKARNYIAQTRSGWCRAGLKSERVESLRRLGVGHDAGRSRELAAIGEIQSLATMVFRGRVCACVRVASVRR